MKKRFDLFNQAETKEVIVRTQRYEDFIGHVMSRRSDVYHQFFCAAIIYKKFKVAITTLEQSIKKRLVSRYDHDGVYQALQDSFLEAVGCSEKIHTELCSQYETVLVCKNKKRLLSIIEQWSAIHFRLWSLAIEKRMI